MINLKTEITKIYEFVNSEFDINDKEELKAIKEGLTPEKLDTLDNMLSNYKKAVNKAKRAEKAKQNMLNYKKIGINLKLEEYEKYDIDSKSKNLTISEYVKKSLEAFRSPKTLQVDKASVDKEIKPCKQDIELLKAESGKLKAELLEKQKMIDINLLEIENQQIKIVRLNTHKSKTEESLEINLKDKIKELKELKERNLFQRIFNI